MSWRPLEYTIQMMILSPVHVGTGEVADPMEYVCMNSEDFDVVGYFESSKMLEKLLNQKKISLDTLEKGNYPKLRKAVYDLFQEDESCDDLVHNWIEISDYRYFNDYKTAIENPRSNKHLEIDKMYSNQLINKYYVPGSSLKGAIRTAIMSKVAEIKNLPQGRSYKDYNTMIAGGIDEDCFKNLIVPDILLDSEQILIVKPEEIKRRQENEGTNTVPKNYCESVRAGEKAKTSLKITEKIVLKGASVSDFAGIKRVLNDFYTKEFYEEWKKFYEKRNNNSKIAELKDRVNTFVNDGWGLVRVGHYSHAESMTLRTVRKIQGRRIGTNDNVFGTTRTLADGNLPFGWIAIKEIT